MASMTVRSSRAPGIFDSSHLWTTIGMCALVFLGAFESLAVTTVMPVVSADLDGASLYALAFAGPFATAVIGMVAAGDWSDRRGPVIPLWTSVVLFAVGLMIAGAATTMPVFVVGRFAQGLGAGAMTVALYVVVARVYPSALHAKIFAGFAAAWVIPSLVGPFAAGAVAEHLHWRWVFLGVIVLVAIAMLMVVPGLRGANRESGQPAARWRIAPLLWATLAAIAVLALNLLGNLPGLGIPLALAAAAVALLAIRPLLPRRTLRAARGLPSVIVVRGLVAAAFFGAEVYLPYLLTDRYAFSPTLAGLALTLAALAWAGASAVQGRMGARLSDAASIRIGTLLVLAAIAVVVVGTLLELSPVIAIVSWAVSGAGMGLMYPRLSVLTLALSTPKNQGFNSSALSIADSTGAALALAATGIVFTGFTASGGPFAAVFVFAGLIAAGAALLAPRVVDSRKSSREAAEALV